MYTASMKTYALSDTDLYLDVSTPQEKEYVLRVRDLPQEQKPREKLLNLGPRALSVSELFAIILGNGTKKEGVLEMANKVVKEYGERVLSSHTDPKYIAKELSIPLVKAMQIVAASELGRRFYDKNAGGLPVLRTAQDAYEYLKDMHNLQKEHVRGIYLNTHHQVIHDEVISIGTVNSNLIHPREVFKPALTHGAAGVLIAHNHPSGIAEASPSDIAVTRQLIEAGAILGITFVDHIIVTKEKFISVTV